MLRPDWFLGPDADSLLPHFLLQSFFLFALLMAYMIVLSLITQKTVHGPTLPPLRELYAAENPRHLRHLLIGWAVLACLMAALYAGFQG
jgi:SSS family solute:Na+ symporter